jgi:hypothetical protein
VLGLIATGGILITAAVTISPRYLLARAGETAGTDSLPEHHRVVLDGVADLVRRSAEVLAVQGRDRSPYVELVLRAADHEPAGLLDASEILVISHSQILQTITVYQFETQKEEAAGTQGAPPWPGWDLDDGMLPPDFCDRWRAHPRVIGRVIATGVADMRVEQASPSTGARGSLRLTLTWPSQTVDGFEAASVLAEAVMRRPLGKE